MSLSILPEEIVVLIFTFRAAPENVDCMICSRWMCELVWMHLDDADKELIVIQLLNMNIFHIFPTLLKGIEFNWGFRDSIILSICLKKNLYGFIDRVLDFENIEVSKDNNKLLFGLVSSGKESLILKLVNHTKFIANPDDSISNALTIVLAPEDCSTVLSDQLIQKLCCHEKLKNMVTKSNCMKIVNSRYRVVEKYFLDRVMGVINAQMILMEDDPRHAIAIEKVRQVFGFNILLGGLIRNRKQVCELCLQYSDIDVSRHKNKFLRFCEYDSSCIGESLIEKLIAHPKFTRDGGSTEFIIERFTRRKQLSINY